MGDRAMCEIKLEEGSIYFYTHWGGCDLDAVAENALEKAQPRITDEPYAARIIIDQLIKYAGGRDEETGSGIMLGPDAEDEYNGDSPSVIIDIPNNLVRSFGRHAVTREF